MAKNTKKKERKKKTKAELVKELRGYKQELQSARFRLTQKQQQQTATRRRLRRSIARTSAFLTELAKERKIADDKSMVGVSGDAGKTLRAGEGGAT